MLGSISSKISKNEKIQNVVSNKIYKRLFISFLILAGLLTVIVPTWQVYTEEGRSSTLISYRDPNIRGESLYISASVLAVNFAEKEYKINFLIAPNGTLANEFGQLNQLITLRFSAIKSYDLETGDAINPLQVTFKYDDGNQIDYPLDSYSGYFDLSAYYSNDTSQSIPITFHLDASITSFHIMPTLQHSQSSTAAEKLTLKITTGRSITTQGFSIFICILMWLLSLVMGMFGYQVVFKRRRADAHACMIGITTLFALPAVRSAQPGIPDVGTVSDILGFYWNMAIIACASIAVIMCWVIRWEHPLSDIETLAVANKHRSTTTAVSLGGIGGSNSLMMMVMNENSNNIDDATRTITFNPNTSCTSVLTCVEPSLRDV